MYRMNETTHTGKSYASHLLAAAFAALLVSNVNAQTPAPASSDQTVKMDSMVTIGSRFNDRTATDSVAPIDIFTTDDIQNNGYTELGQLLSVLVPSINFPRSANTDGTDSIRPATLRALGPGETLVLLDGKRYHTSALVNLNGSIGRGDAAVDLNTIPTFALAGAEVLRDGAAAQYGSDAIAGVINLNLRRDVGFSTTTEVGKMYMGDGATVYGAAHYGVKPDASSYFGATLYFKDSGYTNRAGPDLRQQYYGTNATTGALVAGGTTANVINGNPDSREASFNRGQIIFGDPTSYSRGFFGDFEKKISDNVTFYVTGGANHRLSYSFASWRRADDTTDIVAIYPNGFQPQINPHVTDYDLTAGFKGSLGDGWNFDLSQVYGMSLVRYYTINSLNVSYGLNTPTRFYDGSMEFDQYTSNFDVTKQWNVAFLSSPLKTAFGAEFRAETYTIQQGDPASYANGGATILYGPSTGGTPAFGAQGFPGFQPTDVTNASRNNMAGYADVENQVTSKLDIDLAARAEHYSDAGSTGTGKIGAIYKLNNWLNFRSSFSNGFRAPELQQEYFTTTSSVILTVNGVSGPYMVKTFRVNDPAAVALGATPLTPERSTNVSAGFTANPIDNFTASVDAYNILVTNRIVLSANFATTSVANFLTTQGYSGIEGGRYFTNGLDTRTQGVDFTTSYGLKLKTGDKITFYGSYNYNDTVVTYAKSTPANVLALTSNQPIFDRQNILRWERSTPMNKAVLSQTYDWGKKFSFLLREDWYGKVLQPGSASPVTAPAIIGFQSTDQWLNAKWLFDAEVSWHYNKSITIAVGANNFLNTFPTKLDSYNNTSGQSQYSSFSPFGFDGGYYYGRVNIKF